jgi:3-ketoacyl-CoA synthase
VSAVRVFFIGGYLAYRALFNWITPLLRRTTPRWQENVDYFVLHAAGNSILKGLGERLGLTDAQAAHNFTNFNTYGNTSSTSLYYGLHELERSRELRRGDRLLFLGYGSGFMTRCMYATACS